MALHSAIKGKLISVIGDEVSKVIYVFQIIYTYVYCFEKTINNWRYTYLCSKCEVRSRMCEDL